MYLQRTADSRTNKQTAACTRHVEGICHGRGTEIELRVDNSQARGVMLLTGHAKRYGEGEDEMATRPCKKQLVAMECQVNVHLFE